MSIIRAIRGSMRGLCVTAGATVLSAGAMVALADYTATQGSGTTFASLVLSAKHYMAMALCDATAGEAQCAAVNSSGQVGVVLNAETTKVIGEVNQGTSPWVNSVTTWGGGTLGAMANYGTSPGAVLVPGVNSFMTNPLPSQAASVIVGGVGVPSWAGGTLGAMANYGTSPGAVLVPGVNAFITNTVPGNITQFGGNNVATGTGAGGNGIPRVTISNDSSLAANQSVNTSQVNGVTVLTGTGATGTGAQRVTVSTDQATNAGAALVKGGVGVVNGGSFYQAVAASQTAAVLQSSTGATGDYLSHCVIYPTSTSPGVVTVFDNTNTAANSAVLFPGGASSTSNLVPFAVPVGAISKNGPWEVTTGANVSVVCYGKFS